MTPVFQKIFDPGKGDCMQAALASLLDKKYEDVPEFVKYPDGEWFPVYFDYLRSSGYEYIATLYNRRMLGAYGKDDFERLKNYDGVDGYFYVSVLSPKYFDPVQYILNPFYVPVKHAVIIDKDFNIVHDPNPLYKELKQYPLSDRINYNGIVDIWIIEK